MKEIRFAVARFLYRLSKKIAPELIILKIPNSFFDPMDYEIKIDI